MTYELDMEHIDLVYHFLYGDIAVFYDWLASLTYYVRPSDRIRFGSFRVRVVFDGRDLLNDEPVADIACYLGYVTWPQNAAISTFAVS